MCAGGATRCSITEEVRRRAALQPLNDPELLVGWDVLALPKRTRVGSVEEVRPCYRNSVAGKTAIYPRGCYVVLVNLLLRVQSLP